ncbi:hypothetical protein A33M_3263 [Rhodovulum sp. PH10]|nr:hypothetical protein A33M_3263 [Rhodovulum sp. PH10]
MPPCPIESSRESCRRSDAGNACRASDRRSRSRIARSPAIGRRTSVPGAPPRDRLEVDSGDTKRDAPVRCSSFTSASFDRGGIVALRDHRVDRIARPLSTMWTFTTGRRRGRRSRTQFAGTLRGRRSRTSLPEVAGGPPGLHLHERPLRDRYAGYGESPAQLRRPRPSRRAGRVGLRWNEALPAVPAAHHEPLIFVRFPGPPRSTTRGTVASPWRYEGVAEIAITPPITRGGCHDRALPRREHRMKLGWTCKWRATVDEDGQYCFAMPL